MPQQRALIEEVGAHQRAPGPAGQQVECAGLRIGIESEESGQYDERDRPRQQAKVRDLGVPAEKGEHTSDGGEGLPYGLGEGLGISAIVLGDVPRDVQSLVGDDA